MLVSVITPTYNSEKFIMETYSSLVSQTFQKWEWLVTDDCSTDNTYSILLKLSENDDRIKVFRNNFNSGAAHTRNVSILRAKGDFLAFLDSDDLWVPEKLEKQIFFMKDSIDFSFTAYSVISEDGYAINKIVDSNIYGGFTYADMLKKKATLGCSTVMLRKNAFCDISMPLIKTGQDYALWLKLLKQGGQAYIFNEVLTKYRIVSNSISRNKFKKAKRQWQIYREIENISLYLAIICFCHYAWRAVFRK